MRKIKYRKSSSNAYISLLLIILLGVAAYFYDFYNHITDNLAGPTIEEPSYSLSDIPEYSGENYVIINNNEPFFDDDELTISSLEAYSDLDALGRCGVAVAKIGIDTMPTKKRGSISSIKPSGWHLIKYDNIEDRYLYNRCHLIGYQLAGENANEKNLITCTRQMNTEGMLPFENLVADYVKETKHHVLYRVTPMYDGDNLLASGVLMEAQSIEDDTIKYNVYVYNHQDGITIDYATGDSKKDES